MKVTNRDIPYHAAGSMHKALIPARTPVVEATNLPTAGYWVEPWDGMTEAEDSWMRNYGYLVTEHEVEEAD